MCVLYLFVNDVNVFLFFRTKNQIHLNVCIDVLKLEHFLYPISSLQIIMAPDLNKKLEDEVEKYRQTQNGTVDFFCFLNNLFFLDMKKFVTQQQQLFITKTENEFVKQVRRRVECISIDEIIFRNLKILIRMQLFTN